MSAVLEIDPTAHISLDETPSMPSRYERSGSRREALIIRHSGPQVGIAVGLAVSWKGVGESVAVLVGVELGVPAGGVIVDVAQGTFGRVLASTLVSQRPVPKPPTTMAVS